MCRITTKAKGYPFEVPVPSGCGVSGVILADHCLSLDYRARRATLVAQAPRETTDAVLELLAALLEL